MIVLICASLSYSKSELKKIVRTFELNAETLRNNLSTSTYHKVVGTDVKRKISDIKYFINNLDNYLNVE